MIEVLGGEIWFESIYGKGSWFYIRFPVSIASESDMEGKQVGKKSVDSIYIEKLERIQRKFAKIKKDKLT